MIYKQLGNSDLKASKIILGTLNFGSTISKSESYRIMSKALDLGINFFDTGNNYGIKANMPGISETTIGQFIKDNNIERDKLIINTKFNFEDDMANIKNSPVNKQIMIKQINDSLKRLQMDYVDVATVHFEVDNFKELWDGYECLINENKVKHAGASNFSAYGIVKAQEMAKQRNLEGFIFEQNRYNLCSRLVELEMIRTLNNENISLLCWGPLHSGRLTHKVFNNEITFNNPLSDDLKDKLKRFANLCEEYGYTEEEIAMAWLLNKDVFVLTGANSVEELEKNVKCLDIDLSDEIKEKIDEIFNGYLQAPSAYLALDAKGSFKVL